MKCKIWHFNANLAFFNGILAKENYEAQLEGFVAEGSENKAYKLHKALYRLKLAQPGARGGQTRSLSLLRRRYSL